jgi:uncharacterized protein (TIGR03086 family)
MSENLRNYVKAVYAFDHVLKLTPDRTWTKKAPCAGWTGKDVYEHAAGGVKMVQSFATENKPPRSSPRLGKNPLKSWEKLRDETLEALDQPGVIGSMAHDPFGPDFGPMPMDMLVGVMGADLMVHVWDLARTAKVDARLDPALCKWSLALWKSLPEEVLRGPGMFGPPVSVTKGADTQTRMLNFLGREV